MIWQPGITPGRHHAMHLAIPIPLADAIPGPLHRDRTGRCWFGHADAHDPLSGEWLEASWTLTTSPDPADTHWMAGTALPVAPVVPEVCPDLSDLSWSDHPSLTAADRNPSLVGR